MKLYHGSLFEIKNPLFKGGKPNNDYGVGFYCTEDIELAKEWGCSEEKDGFANEYDFDINALSVLDLNGAEFSILNWLAILLENRTFETRSEIAVAAKEYLLKNFSVQYEKYDVIKGYRADDSYFSFANAFLNNTISLQKLNVAMKLGKLGEQVVLKSEKSFSNIYFVRSYISSKETYYPKKIKRDFDARTSFSELRIQKDLTEGIFMLDIIRQELKNASIQSALS